VKELIVTADDVGLHRGTTAGAIQAHRDGIVTACSVCACGPELDHALEALAAVPALDVGAHLMLVEGTPLLPAGRIPSLTRRDGRFRPHHLRFVTDYLIGRVSLRDVEAELDAQLARLTSAGLRLTHVNSHQHLHMLPGIFGIVVSLATRYSIPYVRVVREARGSSRTGGRSAHGAARSGAPGRPSVARRTMIRALALLAHHADAGRLQVNDRTMGVMEAGHLSAGCLLALLPRVEGLTELVAHPGIGNRELARVYDWRYDWDAETAALCDPAVRRAMDQTGIHLRGIVRA
jgi:hopanoid biosynthesis associated protein HpnK